MAYLKQKAEEREAHKLMREQQQQQHMQQQQELNRGVKRKRERRTNSTGLPSAQRRKTSTPLLSRTECVSNVVLSYTL